MSTAQSTRTAPAIGRPGSTEGLVATAHAVASAADGHLHQAIESVEWERRGFLQRLKRDT